MKKPHHLFIFILTALFISACSPAGKKLEKAGPAEQTDISRISMMPNQPEPYKMLDWKQISLEFDDYVFNFDLEGEHLPFIWIDDSRHNFDQETFGLFTAIGDVRFGKHVHNGEFHEALNGIGAVLGASLVGIDKSRQGGYNFVRMLKNYFNIDNGWNIVMNNTNPAVGGYGGGYSWDFWYDIYPNLLFYAVGDLYPGEEGYAGIMRTVADQFFEADQIMDGNYGWATFNFAEMTPVDNGRFKQEDVAAAFSWVLYMAYQKFGNKKYLEGALSAMDALQNLTESRFWEILLPFGAYTAARMNAELGTNFEITKIIDWTFDGTATNRLGWGVIADRWGPYDVHGIVGSVRNGYGFLMNTFDLAWPLIPMVRYDQSYARSMAKWLLNAANAARLFYPYEIPDQYQLAGAKKEISRNVIAYEGLRITDKYKTPGFENVSPVALGDGPDWVKENPTESMFSLYGAGHVGIFGSIIKTTNVEKILQIDCLKTDFFRQEAYPTYLYFNPHNEEKTVDIQLGSEPVDLYDAVNRTFVAKNVSGQASFGIAPDAASLIVLTPAGGKISFDGKKMLIDGVVVDYNM